jgi:hypothetical protein
LGSTSGWLVPTYYAKEVWKIDPKTFWKYSEGATHAANEVAVSAGQVDMATDFDRNRNAMIAGGNVKADSNKIIWTSDPLPNAARFRLTRHLSVPCRFRRYSRRLPAIRRGRFCPHVILDSWLLPMLPMRQSRRRA